MSGPEGQHHSVTIEQSPQPSDVPLKKANAADQHHEGTTAVEAKLAEMQPTQQDPVQPQNGNEVPVPPKSPWLKPFHYVATGATGWWSAVKERPFFMILPVFAVLAVSQSQ